MDATHRFVEANGIRFHVVEQGTGPLVLLLHGFPEFWYSWRHQLPALAGAGFHAVAPDLRGYNLTDKPAHGYRIEELVEDVVELAHALGEGRAHVVGHDWGGIIAWQSAWRRPEFVRSLVTMNAPHPAAFARYLLRSPRQMLQSSYMLFFQAPGLAEWALTRRNAAAIASALRRSARHPEVFTAADIEAYRAAFLRPGVARCSLAYYRQAFRQRWQALPDSPIETPTLVLWGQDDPVLRRQMNDRLGEWVKNITIRLILDCGHWTQQEQPDVVSHEVIGWLRAHTA
ncbi:MAG: alpha/beta hydrolase [Chloroflexota bacterium]|nr:alpha/beta hydrolase [Chloroflexota bacterium]